jgi:hypothetical protein
MANKYLAKLDELKREYEEGKTNTFEAYRQVVLLIEQCGENGTSEEVERFNALASELEKNIEAVIPSE